VKPLSQLDKEPNHLSNASSTKKRFFSGAKKLISKKASSQSSLERLSSVESQIIVHELKVHQNELEMQNKELREIQIELDESKRRYFDLYDLAPVGYIVLSITGRIIEANLYIANVLGIDRHYLINKKLNRYIYMEDYKRYNEFINEGTDMSSQKTCELRMTNVQGNPFWVQIEAVNIMGKDTLVHHLIISDITKRKVAELALIESEMKYRLMYQHMAQGMALLEVVLDDSKSIKDYIILETNHSFAQLLNLSEKQLIGKNITQVIGESQSYWLDIFEGAVLKGQPTYCEKQLTMTGRYYAFSSYITVDNQCVMLISDINERVKREQDIELENARLEEQVAVRTKDLKIYLQAVEQSPASVEITDISGKIIYVNKYFVELTGYDYDEVIGRNASMLQSGVTSETVYTEIWDTISSGHVWRGELFNKKKNEEFYWEDVAISPIIDDKGNAICYLAVKEDITKYKELIVELELAKEKAETATQAKSDFLANMSHEIRTPMSAIIGLSELALNTELSEKQSNYMQKIHSAGMSLLSIVNDVLDFSKIEAGLLRIEKEVFCINDIIEKVLDIASYKTEKFDRDVVVELDSAVPTNLIGDSLRLSQVLTNLVNNALKFSVEGDIILGIKCIALTADNATIEFSVQDFGIGIEEDKKELLFSAFDQGDTSTTREYGGTGLGLAICKDLVEMMDGTIDFTSTKGKGSRFFFQLTFSLLKDMKEDQNIDMDGHDITLISNDMIDLNGIHILLVEDNTINQEVIQELLTLKGAQVDIAKDGQEAIDIIVVEKRVYDLVLMDIQMPVMGGYEATSIIREYHDMDTLPIIAITADAMVDSDMRSNVSGMNDYLIKPIDHKKLYKSITKWVNPLEQQ